MDSVLINTQVMNENARTYAKKKIRKLHKAANKT